MNDRVLHIQTDQVDVFENAKKRELAIERLEQGGTIRLDDVHATLAARLVADGSVRNAEFRTGRKDDEPIDCLVSAENVSINGQSCVLMAWLDISERKRSALELVSAIKTVMQDASWFSRSLIEKLANVARNHGHFVTPGPV